MSIEPEFATVDLLVQSSLERRGVDAFSLSIIKTERQVRRIFTHIVYQSPSFRLDHIDDLIRLLAENRRVYLKGFIGGIEQLGPAPLSEMYQGDYKLDLMNLKRAQEYRNKIFHGQLTGKGLGTGELLKMVDQLKDWCEKLANGSSERIGYDGIGDSYVKSSNSIFQNGLKVTLGSIDDYNRFLKKHVEKP